MGSALVDPAIARAGDIDTAVVVLHTASGKLCQISNSRRASYGYDQRIEVHGATGMLRADNLHENSVEYAGNSGFTRAPLQHFFLERYALAYRAEMQAFVDAVRSGQPVPVGGEDGLKALILGVAALRSLKEHRPVKIG